MHKEDADKQKPLNFKHELQFQFLTRIFEIKRYV